jgi:DNA-binding NarL/FixJ family response regulator
LRYRLATTVRQARRLDPDVVLMDVWMPVMDGLEAARQILTAAADGRPRVLMLTTFDIDEYVYEALRAKLACVTSPHPADRGQRNWLSCTEPDVRQCRR